MKRILAFSCVALLLASVWEEASAQKSDGDAVPANAKAYELLAKYREMVGTIQASGDGKILLRVSYNRAVVLPKPTIDVKPANNDNAQKKLAERIHQLQVQLAKLRKGKETKDEKKRIANLENDVQQAKAQIYRLEVADAMAARQAELKEQLSRIKMEKDYIDYELFLAEKLVVRKLVGKVEYDNQGFPIERPNDGLPGIPAKLSDVSKGDEVAVLLSPPLNIAIPPKKDEMGAIIHPGIPAGRPYIRQIVIMNDK